MDGKQEVRELLFQAEMARKTRLHPIWAEMGLIAGQPRVLSRLLVRDNVTQKELSDACRIDPATLSRALDKLEVMGFISRMAHPTCRRSLQIMLTEPGREKAVKVRGVFQDMEHRMMEGISDEEIHSLIDTLERIYHNITR